MQNLFQDSIFLSFLQSSVPLCGGGLKVDPISLNEYSPFGLYPSRKDTLRFRWMRAAFDSHAIV